MFSYEDWLRAVRLYIKLGKRLDLTIRQLGYPTKNALKAGYREYEHRLDLPAGYVCQPRYSQTHKERAVEHHREHGRCISATIKALGYPSRSVPSAWIQELNPQARVPVFGRAQELTPEAKQSDVIALCMRPASAQAVAEDVGISRGSLYKWKNQLLDHEDTSLIDRAEGRADRFDDDRDKRTDEAERATAQARRVADGIPFGQPIRVGHHSERHARKDAERIQNGSVAMGACW